MTQHRDESRFFRRFAAAGALLASLAGASANAGNVVVPGNSDFPESLTGTPDGARGLGVTVPGGD